MATRFNPGIAVCVLDDLVRNFFQITLAFWICEFATNQALRCEECVLWVDNGLTLGGNTDEALTVLGECND